MDPEAWARLFEYVQQAKQAGLDVAQIAQNMRSQGWDDPDLEYYVQQAYDQAAGAAPVAAVPPAMAPGSEPQVYSPPAQQPVYAPPQQQTYTPPQQPSYAPPPQQPGYPAPSIYAVGNNSGQGPNTPVPPEVEQMGWSWGGFGLNWIWGIGNKTMIALLALIPCVNIFVAIWLGLSGHKLAWQNRRFDSLQQYQETMRAWNTWGLWIFIASLVINVIQGLIAVAKNN